MTRRLAGAALAWVLVLATPALAQDAATTRPVRGQVADADTGEPVAQARIRAFAPRVAETVTDRSGLFDLLLVTEPVQLEATRQGYDPLRVTIAPTDTMVTLRLRPRPIPVATVEVTTTRATERGSAVAFTQLDRAAIQDKYWAQDVPMLLAETPGVYAYSDAGNGIGYSYVKIRGFPQRRVAVT